MKSPAPSRPQKMALIPACIFLCFAALSVQAEETSVTPQPPDILLGPLFNDVQNAKLFPDQKTFADAVPNSDPLMILADYRMQQNQSGFDLRHFVNVNFTLPKEGEKYVPPEGQSLREHIDGLWPVLTRSTENTEKWDSLLPLPKPYVVPGGRFREVYYWDSYFTMLGLAESGHWDKVADMVLMGLAPTIGAFSVPGKQERLKATEQLEKLGILHLAARRWNTLSGGERQLALIARALVQQPRLLLLDEPASSLDFGHQIQLLDTLAQLKNNGMTMLMSTHHPLHANAIADSIIQVEPDGRVTQGLPTEQLTTKKLAALYRVSADQIHHHLSAIKH